MHCHCQAHWAAPYVIIELIHRNKKYCCDEGVHNNQNHTNSLLIKDRQVPRLIYLVTAFVPSDAACLASLPGYKRRTDL